MAVRTKGLLRLLSHQLIMHSDAFHYGVFREGTKDALYFAYICTAPFSLSCLPPSLIANPDAFCIRMV